MRALTEARHAPGPHRAAPARERASALRRPGAGGLGLLLFVAWAICTSGCECGREVSVGFDDAMVVPEEDASARFVPPDAAYREPACTAIERRHAALPDVGDDRPWVHVHEDRVLVSQRDETVVPTTFRFFSGPVPTQSTLARTFEPLAEWVPAEPGGTLQHARFRDGAWELLVGVFPRNGLFMGLRVAEDGAVSETLYPAPSEERLRPLSVVSLGQGGSLGGQDYAVVAQHVDGEDDDIRLVRLGLDGTLSAVALEGVGRRQVQLVPLREQDEIVVVAYGRSGRTPPRVRRLRANDWTLEPEWTELEGIRDDDLISWFRVHDTARGLITSVFRAGLVDGERQPEELRVDWLDSAFRSVATWTMPTAVGGALAVADARSSQDFLVTLHDSRRTGVNGTATIFHGRSSEPGELGALRPVGRTPAAFPPEVSIDELGRTRVVHHDDRLEIEVLCEAQ